MEIQKVERATRMLERLKSEIGITQDGIDWLIATLDPCHDEKLTCRGYCDDNIGPSVVQVIKQSYDIAVPSNFGTDTWGFHVWLDDYIFDDVAATSPSVSIENNSILMDETVTVSAQLQIGGLCGTAFDQTAHGTSDVTTLPPVSSGTKNTPVFGAIIGGPTNIPVAFAQGKVRKLGEAFEICNTTAELYRGGSVLCYEQPSTKNEPASYWYNITTATLDPEIVKKYGPENIFIEYPKLIELVHLEDEKDQLTSLAAQREVKKNLTPDEYTRKRFFIMDKGQKVYLDKHMLVVNRNTVRSMSIDNTPPIALSEAMLLPGTQQWAAEEGVYCVQFMNTLENPPSYCNTMGSVYTRNELAWPNVVVNPDTSTNSALTAYPTVDAGLGFDNFTNNYKTPFNKKGAIFSGLTPQSTFKLNRTIILERFVSSSDSNLVVLANMSPCRDPIALKLYSEVVRSLPIAAKFSDNGLGDWFMGCVDTVAGWVSSIGKPIVAAADTFLERDKKPSSRKGGGPVEMTSKPHVQRNNNKNKNNNKNAKQPRQQQQRVIQTQKPKAQKPKGNKKQKAKVVYGPQNRPKQN